MASSIYPWHSICRQIEATEPMFFRLPFWGSSHGCSMDYDRAWLSRCYVDCHGTWRRHRRMRHRARPCRACSSDAWLASWLSSFLGSSRVVWSILFLKGLDLLQDRQIPSAASSWCSYESTSARWTVLWHRDRSSFLRCSRHDFSRIVGSLRPQRCARTAFPSFWGSWSAHHHWIWDSHSNS